MSSPAEQPTLYLLCIHSTIRTLAWRWRDRFGKGHQTALRSYFFFYILLHQSHSAVLVRHCRMLPCCARRATPRRIDAALHAALLVYTTMPSAAPQCWHGRQCSTLLLRLSFAIEECAIWLILTADSGYTAVQFKQLK